MRPWFCAEVCFVVVESVQLPRSRPAIARYGVMLAAVALALGVTALIPPLRKRESFALFFGAVTVSAWYGGHGPGLVSCILSALLADYFIMDPVFDFAVNVEAGVSLLMFVVTAFATSSLTSELARAERETREQWQKNLAERAQSDLKIHGYQVRLRSLASEVLLAEERERRRIATGLHDRVGQTLAACNIRVRTLIDEVPADTSKRALSEINRTLKDIISETRTLTFELSPPTLYEFGLEPALKGLLEEVTKKHGLRSEFVERGDSTELPVEISVAMFQSARELLVNVVKHAQAKRVTLTVENKDDEVGVIVKDDGVGFNVDEASARDKGYGLFSIRERVRHLGGRVEISSQPGNGTSVLIAIPLKRCTPQEAA